jgi:hypothetical protein
VLPGTYNIALLVDGKTIETKPIRVMADPQVALTEIERKKMFDMAMEMHELQKRGTAVADALRPLNTRMAELTKEIAGRSDLPADVTGSFEALNKELTAMTPKFTVQAGGGRGGGGGGGGGAAVAPSVVTRISQAKTGLMGGMWPTEQTIRAYTDAKTQLPKAIADVNALFTKAAALSTALTPFKLTLTAPALVK